MLDTYKIKQSTNAPSVEGLGKAKLKKVSIVAVLQIKAVITSKQRQLMVIMQYYCNCP
ncbi:hypothetical protein [Wolbachia endosymbiont of Brugia pahangi]|uniref:hypothetical protein n=1 Tax=Wolbachia endosymbiont of Brugia pahangi TaxID=96495 RepID=UPI001435C3DA|nr:hypothetical protein [Wolbachia endosymbiont of Brugia pahangi]QIT35714.1 hypothetical protein WBP_0683 [Wolbachia endosymbiont of Brugia pahangi]